MSQGRQEVKMPYMPGVLVFQPTLPHVQERAYWETEEEEPNTGAIGESHRRNGRNKRVGSEGGPTAQAAGSSLFAHIYTDTYNNR